MDPISAGLAGVGLVSGIFGNNAAKEEAAKQRRLTEQLVKRQTAAFDQFNFWLNNSVADGRFDPEQNIQALEADAARTHGTDVKNLAGGMRLLGYGPGDSEAKTQLRAGEQRYREGLDMMRLQQRRQSLMDLMGAYNAVSGASSGLNAGIQNAQFQQQAAMSQQQSPGQLLGTVMPFFRQGSNAPAPAPTTNANPFNLPDGGQVRYRAESADPVAPQGVWSNLKLEYGKPSWLQKTYSGTGYGGI